MISILSNHGLGFETMFFGAHDEMSDKFSTFATPKINIFRCKHKNCLTDRTV